MGIDNFTKLVKKYAPEVIEIKEYQEFAGETWAIDGSIFFYRFAYDPQSKKTNPHIDGFYQLIHRLYKNGIRPVIILDGKTPKQKLHTLEKRKQQKQKNITKVSNLQDELVSMMGGVVINTSTDQNIGHSQQNLPCLSLEQLVEMHKGHPLELELKNKLEEVNKAKKNIIHFQPNTYLDIYTLCSLFCVPILRANYEADALCSKLYVDGKVDAIMSEDSDILLYNGGRLIRKFNWSNKVELIDLNKLLQKLQINYNQFIDLCILCGTDYTVATIKGLGFIKAFELISKGLNIEAIIDNIQKAKISNDKSLNTYLKYYLPEDLNDFDYKSARDLIKEAHGLENSEQIQPFNIDNIDFEQLKTLMVEKCKYQIQTVEKHKPSIVNGIILHNQPKKEKIKISLKMNSNKIQLKTLESVQNQNQNQTPQKIQLTLKLI